MPELLGPFTPNITHLFFPLKSFFCVTSHISSSLSRTFFASHHTSPPFLFLSLFLMYRLCRLFKLAALSKFPVIHHLLLLHICSVILKTSKIN